MKARYLVLIPILILVGGMGGIGLIWFRSHAHADVRQKPQDLKHNRAVQALALAYDGKTLATATGEISFPDSSQQPCDLWIWNTADGKNLHTFTAKGSIQALAFSPDGTLVASGGDSVDFWKVETGALVRRLADSNSVKCLAFSPDGSMLSAVDADGMLTRWTVKTGLQASAWRVSTHYAFAVAYTPKGDVIITGGDYDGQLKFWDSGSGKLLHSVKAHDNAIDSIAVSRDGTRLVTGSWDHTARVWDNRTRKLLFTLKGHSDNVWSVAFSPDGRRIASVSSEIKVWDAANGKLLNTMPGDGMCVSFLRDSQTIVSDQDNLVRIRSVGSH